MRRLPPFVLLLLVACTARWDNVVRYSPEPAAPGRIDATVYAVVVADMKAEWGLHQVSIQRVLDDTSREIAKTLRVGAGPVPSLPVFTAPHQWEDSLKRQVERAVRSEEGRPRSDGPDDATAFRDAEIGVRECHTLSCPLPSIALSPPGYNPDSTIAVVYTTIVCGGTCGRGEWVLLARRPGHAWRIWWHQVDWLS